jgi:uncharacterized integral membrane protein
MRFVSLLLWLPLGALLIWFSVANWTPVSVAFPPFVAIDTKLPLLVFALVFLVALSAAVAHKAARWSWRRQMRRLDKELQQLRGKLEERQLQTQPEALESQLMERARAAGFGDLPPTGHIVAAPPLA